MNRTKFESNERREPVQACWRGMFAGAVGTLPMTAVMKAIHHCLPVSEQYPLPPQQIFEDVAATVGVDEQIGPDQTDVGWLAAHFAYGAACGAAYNLLAHRLCRRGVGAGALFGMAVWAASYLGWLPAFGMRSRAAAEPAGRNAMMIASHLVWGGSTGLLCDKLTEREARTQPPRVS